MRGSRYLIWLASASQAEQEKIGQELAVLSQLYQSSLPVVPGAVLLPDFFLEYLDATGLYTMISSALRHVDATKPRQLNVAAKAIRERILATPLPADLSQLLAHTYTELINLSKEQAGVVIQVYSASQLGRPADEPWTASTPTAFTKAVMAIFAAHFEAKHLAETNYQALLSQTPTLRISLGLVAEKSGYLRYAVDRPDEYLITAILGGDQLLKANALKGDQYRVDKDSIAIISRDTNRQEWQLVVGSKTSQHRRVARLKQSAPKLTDAEILEVARLGAMTEAHRGDGWQLSWLIDSRHQLWLTDFHWLTNEGHLRNQSQRAQLQHPALIIQGKPVVAGLATGPVRWVHEKADLKAVEPGDVIVTELADRLAKSILSKVAALIIETTHPRHELLESAVDQGIPTVIGTAQASHQLQSGLLVTVDGGSGAIYRGKVSHEEHRQSLTLSSVSQSSIRHSSIGQPNQSIPYLATATKLYAHLNNLSDDAMLTSLPIDGIGLLPAELFIRNDPTEQTTLTSRAMTDQLASGMTHLAQLMAGRPVIYRASDLAEEPTKPQSKLLRWRGAARHITHPSLLKMELEAIRRVRDEYGQTQIHLMLPYIRTFREYETIRAMIRGTGLISNHDFRLWILCQVPATLMLADQLLDEESIYGLVLDLGSLHQLMIGVDRESRDFDEQYHSENEAVLAAVERLLQSARQAGKPVLATDESLIEQPELVETLIKAGITGFITETNELERLRYLVASIEQRLIVDHVITQLHQETETY